MGFIGERLLRSVEPYVCAKPTVPAEKLKQLTDQNETAYNAKLAAEKATAQKTPRIFTDRREQIAVIRDAIRSV